MEKANGEIQGLAEQQGEIRYETHFNEAQGRKISVLR